VASTTATKAATGITASNPVGLRRLVMGGVIAVLAPLFGFLGGSMVGGRSPGTELDPMFAWMFAGLAIGAVGAFVAFWGALRWVQANRALL